MTLHVAIEKLLRLVGHPMSTHQIADALNKNGWYVKKDGSEITAYQIHGRTKNYYNIFNRDGAIVSLNGSPTIQPNFNKGDDIKHLIKPMKVLNSDIELLEKVLLNEKNFKSAGIIDNLVCNNPGLYCIWINEIDNLPSPFDQFMKERQHNIIYIGVATGSLSKRFLNQELRAKGHGTFFRSLGATLGFKPTKGSLLGKANKYNFKFSTSDERKIIQWLNENLKVNWVEFSGDFETIETELIVKYTPLLNLTKNPSALRLLVDLRKECVSIANSF